MLHVTKLSKVLLVPIILVMFGALFISIGFLRYGWLKTECASEGEQFSTRPDASKGNKCCEGLKAIDVDYVSRGERHQFPDQAYCTFCGNGECKYPENSLNCPIDCS